MVQLRIGGSISALKADLDMENYIVFPHPQELDLEEHYGPCPGQCLESAQQWSNKLIVRWNEIQNFRSFLSS